MRKKPFITHDFQEQKMEINDRVFTNKILSDDRSSRHFKVILKNKSSLEIWKVPKLSVYLGILGAGLLILISVLWMGNIPRAQVMAMIPQVSESKANSSIAISKLIENISGDLKITYASASMKNQDLILTLRLVNDEFPTEVASRGVVTNLLGAESRPMEAKILGLWKSKTSSSPTGYISVIKLLVPQAAYRNPDAQKIEVLAVEKQKVAFSFLVDMNTLREDLSSSKKLIGMKRSVLSKK